MKNKIVEIKNSVEGLSSKVYTAEERTTEDIIQTTKIK